MGLNIAIIPARGGSKRLPGKNILPLGGKPLITWTIDAALDSGVFDRVYVSTDSQKIAAIARAAGALVPFLRPPELALDESSTEDVITHMVTWVEENEGDVATICILQPTSPLRNFLHIIKANEQRILCKSSSVVSVCEVDHPVEWSNVLDTKTLSLDGFISPVNLKRSQDFPKRYRLNGAIYFIVRSLVGDFCGMYGKNSNAYIMEKNDSIDVDTEFDFLIAESMVAIKEQREFK